MWCKNEVKGYRSRFLDISTFLINILEILHHKLNKLPSGFGKKLANILEPRPLVLDKLVYFKGPWWFSDRQRR